MLIELDVRVYVCDELVVAIDVVVTFHCLTQTVRLDHSLSKPFSEKVKFHRDRMWWNLKNSK